MIFLDTESVGFYGPTVLFQWQEVSTSGNSGGIKLHNTFTSTAQETLDLIEYQMNHKEGVCGFNLSHDIFHYNRTWNILSHLPKNEVPSIIDYHDIETDDYYDKHRFCVIPQRALDLLLIGRRTKFQSTLNQKDIKINRVPRAIASELIKELKARVQIPDIYFAKSKRGYEWQIKELEKDTKHEITPEDRNRGIEVDPNFVNIRLAFNPSTALKAIVSSILGFDVDTIENMSPLKKVEEYAWWPCSGSWLGAAHEHIYEWTHSERRLEYAKNDVVYTRAVYDYLFDSDVQAREVFTNDSIDVDSTLACAVGAMYWHGFAVDRDKAIRRRARLSKIFEIATREVNVNAPKQVLAYLHSACSELEKVAISDTKAETLNELLEWREDNPELYKRVKKVLAGRHVAKEIDLLDKIIKAKRLYVQFKVTGTKSNRMSGGSESYISNKNGSINPQGIKKGPGIRSCFLLADVGMDLDGGDFDAFEVSIADAVWVDPELHKALLSGKKIHALFGEQMYGLSYDKIMATSEINISEPNGYYSRAKRGFFASLYLAQPLKIGKAMWLPTEEAEAGLRKFATTYAKIGESQRAIFDTHAAMSQPNGLGTQVVWKEPQKYVESFLGFRRYFEMEYSVIKALYELSNDPTQELLDAGKGIKVQRRDRVQTAVGATRSALYGSAFNLQSSVIRSITNHQIQSPGGQITKHLQCNIWSLQPRGICEFVVMPMNMHDEVMCARRKEVKSELQKVVYDSVESYRDRVPLIGMKWKNNLRHWGDK
jgi:hypothetical protein